MMEQHRARLDQIKYNRAASKTLRPSERERESASDRVSNWSEQKKIYKNGIWNYTQQFVTTEQKNITSQSIQSIQWCARGCNKKTQQQPPQQIHQYVERGNTIRLNLCVGSMGAGDQYVGGRETGGHNTQDKEGVEYSLKCSNGCVQKKTTARSKDEMEP